jgi:ABC-type glycerol-3-phosphate transport system substrate-binding protein
METRQKTRRFNWNHVALGLLLVAFILSAVRVLTLEKGSSDAEQAGTSGKRIVRILHWQLEPGYRESLAAVIDEYNSLPHVKEANVEIRQMTIPQRVYKQFANVHLISGTAPDILVEPTGSPSSAQMFLEPLGSYLEEVNPYHQGAFLPDSLDFRKQQRLSGKPWRTTFVGDLAPNYIQSLKDYFAIPVSSIGSTRIFCNSRIVSKAKAYLSEGFAATPQPRWIEDCIYRMEAGIETGYVTPNEELMDWLASDLPVQTLGQFFIVCQAVWQIAEQENLPGLVPFSGSNYSIEFPQYKYLEMMTYPIGVKLDYNLSSGVSFEEFLIGWKDGDWGFDNDAMRAYFDFIREFSKQNPAGFKGLDRDQGIRRFILGQAAFMSSGGWDAASVFSQTQSFEYPEMRFEVEIIDFPLSGSGERWQSVASMRVKDQDVSWATPFSVNRTSIHKEWAIDFLRFLTSLRVNERFCGMAGWLPTIKGANVVDHMKPFIPNTMGTDARILANWKKQMGTSIWDTYSGNLWLWGSGEIDYDEFSSRVETALGAGRTGVSRYLFNSDTRSRDAYRSAERARSIQQLKAFDSDPDDRNVSIYEDMILKSLRAYSGISLRILWMRQVEDEPFPEF